MLNNAYSGVCLITRVYGMHACHSLICRLKYCINVAFVACKSIQGIGACSLEQSMIMRRVNFFNMYSVYILRKYTLHCSYSDK